MVLLYLISMAKYWIFLFFLISSMAFAHEAKEGSLYLSAGPFIETTQIKQGSDFSNVPVFFGGAIYGNADTSSRGSIEVGLVYFRKTYERIFSTNTHLVERVDKLSVPIGYRFWFVPGLSLGACFTPSFSVGDYQTIFTDTNFYNTTSARDASEIGMDISLQLDILKNDRFSGLVDLRYFYSLSAKGGEDSNLYSVLLAIKYAIQQK